MNYETFLFGLKSTITPKELSACVMDLIKFIKSGEMDPKSPLYHKALVEDFTSIDNFHTNAAIIQLITLIAADGAFRIHTYDVKAPQTYKDDSRTQAYMTETIQRAAPTARTLAAKKWGPDPCTASDIQVTSLGKKCGFLAAPPTPLH